MNNDNNAAIDKINFEHRNLIYYKSWISGIEEQISQIKDEYFYNNKKDHNETKAKSFEVLSTQILNGVKYLQNYGIDTEDEILQRICNDLGDLFSIKSIKAAFDYQKLLNEVKIMAEDHNEQIKRSLINLVKKMKNTGCSKDEIYIQIKEEVGEASLRTGYPFTQDKHIVELLNLGGLL
jgi:hypothetical protein